MESKLNILKDFCMFNHPPVLQIGINLLKLTQVDPLLKTGFLLIWESANLSFSPVSGMSWLSHHNTCSSPPHILSASLPCSPSPYPPAHAGTRGVM